MTIVVLGHMLNNLLSFEGAKKGIAVDYNFEGLKSSYVASENH